MNYDSPGWPRRRRGSRRAGAAAGGDGEEKGERRAGAQRREVEGRGVKGKKDSREGREGEGFNVKCLSSLHPSLKPAEEYKMPPQLTV